ncbi:GntR family transcriptional regulator [Streptomyces sp. TS71-3]|uniref:GntR family transcriptional regulator n=1 Tax=Streptomyces sp. TS71-3 TaxID=2733862 RepID=UPI001B1F387B|nr:GntR family transcriptional regulator [Streptomyces sp. TS71-3]GHJ41067.1 GntR family transcriptional regulator [Streptomyces sp. TS71-3]
MEQPRTRSAGPGTTGPPWDQGGASAGAHPPAPGLHVADGLPEAGPRGPGDPAGSQAVAGRSDVPGQRGADAGEAPADAPAPVRPGGERPQIQRCSVRGQVLDALRTALVDGDLEPGEVYSAPALAERFGVSATPVREAMQQLAGEGAVEVVPNRGFRVVRRGDRELAELAEVRSLIEVPVILRLARTVSAGCWTELRPLAEATAAAAAAGDLVAYAVTDRAFHRGVLDLSGNQELVRTADDLHRRAQWPPPGGPPGRRRARLLAAAAEHTALLDALVAHDLPVVESLVRGHYGGTMGA